MKFHAFPLMVIMVWFLLTLRSVAAVELALVSTVGTEAIQSMFAGEDIKPDEQTSTDRRQFSNLSDAVLFYLALSQQKHWQPLPVGPLLRPGDRHPHIALMRRTLILYGDHIDASAAVGSDYFDPELAQSLVAFQRRHGMKTDAILGPETRRVLNISPRQRALQIAINLDRQQSFNGRNRHRYIQVNIPEYRLRLIEQGQEVLKMKTIIGRKSRPTPVLESQIQSLVLNPSWNVPRSIAYRDILPKWEQDETYLQQHNIKVVAGWGPPQEVLAESEVDIGRLYRGESFLRFWQPPGVKNALGRVKFMFPNRHAVYLHDTPTRKLFDEAERAFSSGCIRLEKPLLLAHYLMTPSIVYPERTTEEVLATNKTTRIHLPSPVPLYLTYWTAWLNRQNVLHFGEDIYRRDRPELARSML